MSFEIDANRSRVTVSSNLNEIQLDATIYIDATNCRIKTWNQIYQGIPRETTEEKPSIVSDGIINLYNQNGIISGK